MHLRKQKIVNHKEDYVILKNLCNVIKPEQIQQTVYFITLDDEINYYKVRVETAKALTQLF